MVIVLTDLNPAIVDIESALDETPEIDRWCSGPDWVLSVHEGFGTDSEPLLLRVDTDSTKGFGLFARYHLEDDRTMLAGLEPLWGFASPLIGAKPQAVASELAGYLSNDPGWDVLVLPGMAPPTGPHSFTTEIVRGFASLGQVKVGAGITRQTIDLTGGYDLWLAARGGKFRRNLRQAADRAAAAKMEFVDISTEPEALAKIMAIEERSWKGAEGSGITSKEMRKTYETMIARLQQRGRARIHLARIGSADVGYILGGVRAGIYRGLQLSYSAEVNELSVGHLLQSHQLRLLCESGEAQLYDMGMDMDYKQRWADTARESYTVVIERDHSS